MPKHKGFSLIELLIVIAIILIIAAIAIPNLLRARMSANESAAASAVRTITVAEVAYFNNYPSIGYAVQIQDMGTPPGCVPSSTSACVLDDSLATAVPGSAGRTGYQFSATGTGGGGINFGFVVGATPIAQSQTGTRDFCAITDGVLRSEPAGGGVPATATAACLAYPIAQ